MSDLARGRRINPESSASAKLPPCRTVGRPSKRSTVACFEMEGPGSPELDSIAFHPAIQRAAAEAERLRRLAYVAVETLQRLAHQDARDFLDAELFQVQTLRPLLHIQAEIRNLNLLTLRHEDGPLQRVLQLAHI